MPANPGFWPDHARGIFPGKKARKGHQSETSVVIGLLCFYPTPGKEGKLSPEKEILGPAQNAT